MKKLVQYTFFVFATISFNYGILQKDGICWIAFNMQLNIIFKLALCV